MFIVPQNAEKEVAVLNCVQRFFSSLKVGQLLKQCNGTKEKGVSAVPDLLKNTFYHFLNSTKTNWLRFTSMLASEIINNELVISQMKSVRMYSSLMLLFSTLLSVKRQNSGQSL